MIYLRHYLFLTFLTLFFSQCNGQSTPKKMEKTLEFKVWGNCEMCKETIEKALDVKGVKSAIWNMETKLVKVIYDPAKINELKIHALIAATGYDTEENKGSDSAYKALPECCQYSPRKP